MKSTYADVINYPCDKGNTSFKTEWKYMWLQMSPIQTYSECIGNVTFVNIRTDAAN